MRRGCKLNSNTESQLLVVGGSASFGTRAGPVQIQVGRVFFS